MPVVCAVACILARPPSEFAHRHANDAIRDVHPRAIELNWSAHAEIVLELPDSIRKIVEQVHVRAIATVIIATDLPDVPIEATEADIINSRVESARNESSHGSHLLAKTISAIRTFEFRFAGCG